MQIYQLDNDRTWLGDGPREVHSKGHLQVRVAPPEVPAGHAARWVTELCSVVDTPTFGDEGTGSWELIEDHRKAKLYTADGEYKIGDDYESQIYNGLGSIPAWLSTEAPELPEPEPQYKTQFSVLEFRDRFTIDEQLTIRQAQFNDMEVGLVYDAFQAAKFIDINDPRVTQGVDLYVAKGLLEPERRDELLAPELIEL